MKCIGSIILAACLLTGSETVLGQSDDDVLLPLEPSPRNVKVLATDSSGFLWIGTEHGLFRHERRNLRQFLHDPDDPNTLSSHDVSAITVDRDGMIWVGTRDGLNRLDPETLSIIRYRHDPDDPASLPPGRVLALLADRHNQMWIGTHAGLVKLDPSTGRFVRFAHPIDDAGRVNQQTVGSIVQDASGRIWFGSWRGYGVGRFDESTGEYVHFPVWGPHYLVEVMETVRDRMADPIAGLTQVESRQDLSQSFSLTEDTRVLVVAAIEKLSIQPDDVGWLEAADGRIVWNANEARCLHGGGATRNLLCVEEITLGKGSYTVRYRSDEHHSFGSWAAAPPREQDWWGISILPAGEQSLGLQLRSEHLAPNSLPTNAITLYSVNDSVWIGTDSGLMLFDPNRETLAPYSHHPSSGWVAGFRGRLVVGDWTVEEFGELFDIDRRTGRRHRLSTTLGKGVQDVHVAADGTVWIAKLGQGIALIPSIRRPFDFVESSVLSDSPCEAKIAPSEVNYGLRIGAFRQNVRFEVEVTGALLTADGVCWIGTTHGVYRVEGSTVTHYLPDELDPTTIRGTSVTDIIQDRHGAIWASTLIDDRPGRWGGSVNRFYRGELHVFGRRRPGTDGLGGDSPTDLYEDSDGQLWVAHAAGFDEIVDGGRQFRSFTPTVGLGMQVISESADGLVWMGDGEGNIFTFDKGSERIHLVREGRLQEWRPARALQSEADRAMWAALEGFGLVRFDLASGVQRVFTKLDGVASTAFKHHGSQESSDGTLVFETDDGAVTVSPDAFRGGPIYAPQVSDIDSERMASLSFRVLSSAYATPTILQVRVSDLIEDWRSVAPGEKIDLERVPGGRYTIEARELSVGGEGKTTRVDVRVRELVWRTAWFRWLVVLLIAAAVYGLYSVRERHRRQLIAIRRRIARDLHDEVGSQVAGIKLMADLARDESLSPEARRAEIEQISHTATDLVDALKEVSWFIQSDDDNLNHLVDRMRTYAARHLRGMQLVFQADDEDVTPYLPQRGRREFILIFREAVRNCAQHSGASTVSIDMRLEVEDGTLVLEIEDDGVGFEVDGNHNGLGMRAMADRAKILNGVLAVESTPGTGTRWTLTIPVEVAA